MDLDKIRREIDKIDDQILELFCQRMDFTVQVADYKLEHGMEIFRPEREREILEKIRRNSKIGYEDYAARLFELLMKVSRENQQHLIDAKKGE